MARAMNAKRIPRVAMRWLSPAIALAMLGGTGAGLAQESAGLLANDAAIAKPAEPEGPAFVPSAQAHFDTAFAAYAEPAAPAPADHAVDMTTIEPAEPEATPLGQGIASYYGRRFHGRPTASGEAFDMNALTAAHRTLPFGSRVRVTNPRNGQSVVVRINDRGPFVRGRQIDLSRAAAEKIGIVRSGHGTVELELLDG